ncbi:short-chain dehydrogenase [Halobacteriales archaeon QS_8_69_26]|nr:MAG: short-chain dehydrogenase [Halobacteriales archaeon QS_8_69_26]
MSDSKGTALVTGASRGIGYELARLFAGTGYDVVLTARTESDLREAADYFAERFGAETHVIPTDLSDPDGPRQLYDECRERDVEVDVLVNNAGFGTHGPFVENDLETELDQIQVNVTAPTHLTRLFLSDMADRGDGKVLNVASSAAFAPGPSMAVYYATKSYLLSFSEAVAEEVRQRGITVTALCPGPVDTSFTERAGNDGMNLYRIDRHPRTVAREGYRGLMRGDTVVVPGLGMKAAYLAAKHAPRSVSRKVAGWLNRA